MRPIGVIGIHCTFAYLSDKRSASTEVKRLGEIILGVYFCALAYMMLNFRLDQRAFYSHFIHSPLVLYVATAALFCAAVCFLSGMYVQDGAGMAAVLLIFLTIVMESDLRFWQRQGMEIWNQVRILADSACVVVGLLIVATSKRVAAAAAPEQQKKKTH